MFHSPLNIKLHEYKLKLSDNCIVKVSIPQKRKKSFSPLRWNINIQTKSFSVFFKEKKIFLYGGAAKTMTINFIVYKCIL